jgi:predicted dehydrogenase
MRSMGVRARIGVIGAGWWVTENHLPILEKREDVELVAICRRNRTELERVKERFGFKLATDDYGELLVAPLDGVMVTSPHHLHFEHARAALKKGLHVLVEKPLATRAEDARELIWLAKEKEREILIPHGWNFRSYTREARRLVLEDAVGEVEHIVCQMASPRRAQYSGEVGAEGSLVRQDISTYANPARGGGYGWGQLVHAFGLVFRVTDLEPRWAFSLMGRSPTGVDLHDAISVSFINGATGAVSGTAAVPPHRGYQLDLRVFGSEGMLLLDVERERLEVRRQDGEDKELPMPPGSGEYECVEPVERFADLCLGLTVENDGPGEVGLRSVEVLDAAYRSAESGEPEEV